MPEFVDAILLLVVVVCAHASLVARADYLTQIPDLE